MIMAIGILNYWLYYNFEFDYESTLEAAYTKFMWRNIKSADVTFMNVFLVVIHLVVLIVGDLRDLYAEFFFLVGIFPLWTISGDFKATVREEIQLTQKTGEFVIKKSPKYLLQQYQDIAKLAREFCHAYGSSLFFYLLYYLFYYSINLDQLFLPVGVGEKVYELIFACTIAMNFGFGIHFAIRVILGMHFWSVS